MATNSEARPFVFGKECLDALTDAAKASVRHRKNLDFHSEASHPAQRLLNAVEPGSYVRPHRHLEPLKDETLIAVRGAFGLVFFDESGVITTTAIIRANGDAIGANIPRGVFHSLVSLESGSVFFEAKAGPYNPQSDKEWAPWAPPEGHDEAAVYLGRLRTLFEIS
ncbi:MAG: mannose-6-phosphate isomerase [Betaproteobacteria bacterium]|nr:mannose-6-phosphate isomerase [Betaproteobacteria bacterium]